MNNIFSCGKSMDFIFPSGSFISIFVVLTGLTTSYFSRSDLEFIKHSNEFRIFELACFLVSLVGFVLRSTLIGKTSIGESQKTYTGISAKDLERRTAYLPVSRWLTFSSALVWIGFIGIVFNVWFSFFSALIITSLGFYQQYRILRAQKLEEYWELSAFRLRKVLKLESSKLAFIILMFFLADLLRSLDFLRRFFLEEWYWTTSLLIALNCYLVMRIIQTNSKSVNGPIY